MDVFDRLVQEQGEAWVGGSCCWVRGSRRSRGYQTPDAAAAPSHPLLHKRAKEMIVCDI